MNTNPTEPFAADCTVHTLTELLAAVKRWQIKGDFNKADLLLEAIREALFQTVFHPGSDF